MSLETLISTKTRYEDNLDKIILAKIKLLIPISLIFIITINGYIDKRTFTSNINTKDRFICKSTTEGGFTVVIDKADGWILKDEHFIKKGSSISARRCTPIEEDDNNEH